MNSFGIKILECYKIDYSSIAEKIDVLSSKHTNNNYYHAHNFYHYSFVLSCKDSFVGISNKIVPMKKNTFYLFKPEEMHSFFSGQNITSIELKFSLENEELLEITKKLPNVLNIEDPAVESLLAALLTEYKESAFTDSMFYIKFYELLLFLGRINASENRKDLKLKDFITLYNESFKQLLTYIHKNFAQDISLDAMADIMRMEKNYFIKSFKKEFNCTPVHYLNIVRINEAMNLLEYSDDTIEEIAQKVGCASTGSLSSLFKYHWEITPTEYRRRVRESIKLKNN